MAYHVFRTIVDMMKPKAEIVWDALASVGDAGAHKICVMTQENGKPIDLTGCTAQLLVQRQDEATRYLNADFDGALHQIQPVKNTVFHQRLKNVF